MYTSINHDPDVYDVVRKILITGSTNIISDGECELYEKKLAAFAISGNSWIDDHTKPKYKYFTFWIEFNSCIFYILDCPFKKFISIYDTCNNNTKSVDYIGMHTSFSGRLDLQTQYPHRPWPTPWQFDASNLRTLQNIVDRYEPLLSKP